MLLIVSQMTRLVNDNDTIFDVVKHKIPLVYKDILIF